MSEIDDLEVYEAICEASDDGLTTDELAERFGSDKWAMHDACLRLRDGPEQRVTTRQRRDTNLIVFVRRDPDPPWRRSVRRGTIEPFM